MPSGTSEPAADPPDPAWTDPARDPDHSQTFSGAPTDADPDPGKRSHPRHHPVFGPFYRITVGMVGTAVTVLGLVLVPLPGPGWLIVFLGLGILSTEFAWARSLLEFLKHHVRAWTQWMSGQPWWVRGLVGSATLACVAAVSLGLATYTGLLQWPPF